MLSGNQMLYVFAAAVKPLSAPPTFGVPGFFDAPFGWLIALAVLLAPSAVLAWRSHLMLGHWTRYFFQWRRVAWWLTVGGSLALALGVLGWLGAMPSWQAHWQSWRATAQAHKLDATLLSWLDQTQSQDAHLIGFCILILVLGGLAITALGFWWMTQNVLVRRRPVVASTGWMMAPPVTRSHD